MTDNEIVKAIEICAKNRVTRHNGLTYQGMPLHFLFEEILGFVNRQNSNIEELKSKNSNLISDLSSLRTEIERLKAPKFIIEQKPLSEKEMREALKYASLGVIIDGETTIKRIDEEGIKAEAVKEFAERLILYMMEELDINFWHDYPELEQTINEFVGKYTEGKTDE